MVLKIRYNRNVQKRRENCMFQKLEDVEKRYEELTVKVSDPEIISR